MEYRQVCTINISSYTLYLLSRLDYARTNTVLIKFCLFAIFPSLVGVEVFRTSKVAKTAGDRPSSVSSADPCSLNSWGLRHSDALKDEPRSVNVQTFALLLSERAISCYLQATVFAWAFRRYPDSRNPEVKMGNFKFELSRSRRSKLDYSVMKENYVRNFVNCSHLIYVLMGFALENCLR